MREITKKPKFLRRVWHRYSKLGKGRKKKQKWRRPTGRDNKMRESRKGKPATVSIGYKTSDRKEIFVVNNLMDLEKVNKNQVIVIGKIGRKKKIEILKMAKQKNIELWKTNPDKYLKKNEKIEKEEKKDGKKDSKKTKGNKKPKENKPMEEQEGDGK